MLPSKALSPWAAHLLIPMRILNEFSFPITLQFCFCVPDDLDPSPRSSYVLPLVALQFDFLIFNFTRLANTRVVEQPRSKTGQDPKART